MNSLASFNIVFLITNRNTNRRAQQADLLTTKKSEEKLRSSRMILGFITAIITLFMVQVSVYAQTPTLLHYQAFIRNTDGKILKNKIVSFNIDVIQNNQTIYSETQSGINTGTKGIAAFKIGEGSTTGGKFSTIDWGTGAFKIRISMNGGLSGIFDVTAVPVTFYASCNQPVTLGEERISVENSNP